MDRTTLIEWFTGAYMVLIGLSHMAQPRLWSDLFVDLLSRRYAGLYIGTLTFPLGLLIALGHNVWVAGIPVLVTIVGWGWTIKGSLYLVLPHVVHKVGGRHVQHPRRFALAGAVFLCMGAAVVGRLVWQTLQ
jgi:hypothetical protein